MGLSLRNIGRKLWETVTPQNEQAQRNANANLQRANQQISEAKNFKYGALAQQPVREQFVQQNQPVRPVSTFKPFDNSLTRGLSRGFDQAYIFDNNRTWQQTTPTQTKSTFQQLGQFGGQIPRQMFPASIKLANTAKAGFGGAYGLGKIGASSLLGSDQDYQNTVNDVSATLTRDLRGN